MSGTDLLETDQPEETSTGKPRGSIPRICDIVLVYIAFDILYMDDQSVINRTLKVQAQKCEYYSVLSPQSNIIWII